MAKERLSKLQKWILCAIHKREWGYILKQEIYERFYGFENQRQYSEEEKIKAASAYVVVHMCLRVMVEKGLVERYLMRYKSFLGGRVEHSLYAESEKGKFIKLTEKGQQIADSLIIKLSKDTG